MSGLIKAIEENRTEIAYVTRSWVGSWNVSLIKKGNITGRSISSYEQCPNEDLEHCRNLGIPVFDFHEIREFPDKTERFQVLAKEMEVLNEKLVSPRFNFSKCSVQIQNH